MCIAPTPQDLAQVFEAEKERFFRSVDTPNLDDATSHRAIKDTSKTMRRLLKKHQALAQDPQLQQTIEGVVERLAELRALEINKAHECRRFAVELCGRQLTTTSPPQVMGSPSSSVVAVASLRLSFSQGSAEATAPSQGSAEAMASFQGSAEAMAPSQGSVEAMAPSQGSIEAMASQGSVETTSSSPVVMTLGSVQVQSQAVAADSSPQVVATPPGSIVDIEAQDV
ncbi:MAG: hypothetical protein J3Q66DRAFT_397813 [Benniella sp.]|nr:MAG: hypothetical protein J3Q66DRAFT_397813 [Benniella sp.]